MHPQRVNLHPDRYPDADCYPFNQAILRQTESVDLKVPVTFFIGENGAGKSTLLEAMSHRCGIHIWRGAERGRYEVNPHEDQLYRYITVEWTDGKVPGSFFGGESLGTKSHGQSMMAYFQSRYGRRGLYLLDEPETALSPRSQLGLVRILREMAEAGHAQFVVATHSPVNQIPGDRLLPALQGLHGRSGSLHHSGSAAEGVAP